MHLLELSNGEISTIIRALHRAIDEQAPLDHAKFSGDESGGVKAWREALAKLRPYKKP